MIMVLLFGLPYLLPRIFCPDTPRVVSTADKDLNSCRSFGGILFAVFLVGFMFWLHKLAIPPLVIFALSFVVFSIPTAVWAWRRPWRRFALAWALALMALGIVIPFFQHDPRKLFLMVGYAMAIGSFAGAMILHLQLKAHDADGKAAH